jgi:hypothetical protein
MQFVLYTVPLGPLARHMRHRSEPLEVSLSKFRLFGRWRVSRVEWRAPRPVQSISQATSSGPSIDSATEPAPHFQTAHQERHSHYASDDFTPAVRSAVVLCLF